VGAVSFLRVRPAHENSVGDRGGRLSGAARGAGIAFCFLGVPIHLELRALRRLCDVSPVTTTRSTFCGIPSLSCAAARARWKLWPKRSGSSPAMRLCGPKWRSDRCRSRIGGIDGLAGARFVGFSNYIGPNGTRVVRTRAPTGWFLPLTARTGALTARTGALTSRKVKRWLRPLGSRRDALSVWRRDVGLADETLAQQCEP
jgi:hypothetical protein